MSSLPEKNTNTLRISWKQRAPPKIGYEEQSKKKKRNKKQEVDDMQAQRREGFKKKEVVSCIKLLITKRLRQFEV